MAGKFGTARYTLKRPVFKTGVWPRVIDHVEEVVVDVCVTEDLVERYVNAACHGAANNQSGTTKLLGGLVTGRLVSRKRIEDPHDHTQ